MNILHIEASPGWGGQEIRILRECEGMRARGHHVVLAIQKEGGLVEQARCAGFIVYELSFQKIDVLKTFLHLRKIINKHQIGIINTHSSMDAWLGGICARLMGKKVVRTRHLSTPIRAGLNSRLLYNVLADAVTTTCEEIVGTICQQAHLDRSRCFSIPTGLDPRRMHYTQQEAAAFRKHWHVGPQDFLAGTLCILRGWKGVSDFLQAAKLLEHVPDLKWMVVGSGVSEQRFLEEARRLNLHKKVIFTGYLSTIPIALGAMDAFLLLSWANEGVSQASLQAAWLEKPLVTTPTGGLKEVCVPGVTGIQVPVHSARAVADAVLELMQDSRKCLEFGRAAKHLVEQKFTFEGMLNATEALYRRLL